MDLSRLIDLCKRYSHDESGEFQDFPGLTIYRRDAVSDIEATLYEPVICLILQGSKMTSIGDEVADLHPGDALLVSHALPVMSRITKASAQEPYLAVILSLDLAVLRSLYELVAEAPAPDAPVQPLAKGPAEAAWLGPLCRYLELIANPLDAKVLGPGIRREIHYRLLLSPLGRTLRQLLVPDSHASRIARAIHKVRAEFRSPLSVAELAKTVAMSPSSFHEHFKTVTGTTPLQYQKDLRLIEARALLAGKSHAVAEAAYAVGYESPTHFSRDYSRKFGRPPSREMGLAAPSPAAILDRA